MIQELYTVEQAIATLSAVHQQLSKVEDAKRSSIKLMLLIEELIEIKAKIEQALSERA